MSDYASKRKLPAGRYPVVARPQSPMETPNSGSTIKVLVADAAAMSCQLLVDALQRSHRFDAVAATTRESVIDAVSQHSVQLALISSNFLEDFPGFVRLLGEIRHRAPEVAVIALLDTIGPDAVVESFRAGARGVFSRTDSFQTLCKCIQCVHDGQVWARSEELAFVLDALAQIHPMERQRLDGFRLLSKREEEIARLVAEGLSNREISQRLSLSEHTIKNYLFRTFEKLGVATRVELALYALSQGSGRRDPVLRKGTSSTLTLSKEIAARPPVRPAAKA